MPLEWLRLQCSSKHSFAERDMSPEWKTITYQRSYCMEDCSLAIVTMGHLGKDKKTLWKGPSPLVTSITVSGQQKQPIAWTGDAQFTRSPLPLKPYEGPTWKTIREGGNRDPFDINTEQTITCSRYGKTCLSRIGFISHQRACTRQGLPPSWIFVRETEPRMKWTRHEQYSHVISYVREKCCHGFWTRRLFSTRFYSNSLE